MTSPLCLVNGLSTTNGVDVTPGSTVTIQLIDTAGVNTWEITCIGTDDLLTTDDINDTLNIIDVTAKTATFTMPNDDGYSVILRSRVNLGVDINGRTVSSYTTTFKVATLINSNRTIAVNEQMESSAAFGWAKPVNNIIRAALSGELALGGDLSGIYPNAVVEKIDGTTIVTSGGALTTGHVLTVTGAAAADWQAIPNTLTGDVGGTFTSNTVNKIKGTTVTTAGGSLPDGYVLRTTGVATSDWGKLDLANANSITGTLPLANRPSPIYAAAIMNNPISITGGAGLAKIDLIAGAGSISNGLTISTASDNITVVTAGVYRIYAGILIANASGSVADTSAAFFKNGTQITTANVGQLGNVLNGLQNGTNQFITFEQVVSLAASDVIDVQYASNVNTTIQGGIFSMTLL